MTELNADRARRAIVEYTRRLAESAAAAGPDAAVPTAPEWTVSDLVEHVGQTQHWVAESIERRITDPAHCPWTWPYSPPTPAMAGGAVGVRERVATRAPMTRSTRRCSTPRDERSGTDSGCPASSTRRSSTASTQPTRHTDRPTSTPTSQPAHQQPPPDAHLPHVGDAAVRVRSRHPGHQADPQWLATDTVDDTGAWFVEQRPDGATWQPGNQQADVTVAGPAGSLLLILTRRLPLTDREATNVSVDGDTELAEHWLDNTAHVAG